jgi:RimJ/RimL family protein N-acetyltransferase
MSVTTDRLLLRRWREEDIDLLAAIHADPEVMAWLGSAPIDRATTAEYIAHNDRYFDSHGIGVWAVERRDDGAFLGFSGVRPFAQAGHPMSPCTEAAWRLRRSEWGQGYATEAACAALADAFERVGLERVMAWTASINRRSQAVMERIGMVRQPGLDFDAPTLPEDHPLRPHVVYASPS